MKKSKLNIEKFKISELTNSSKILGGDGGGDGQGETVLGETGTKPLTRPTQITRPS